MKTLPSSAFLLPFYGFKRKNSSSLVAFMLALVTLLASCDVDKNDPSPTPAATGVFSGTVRVQDEIGQPVAVSSGVTVTLEGGPALLRTVTDASGNFQFKDLPWGSYTVGYRRQDVGTWQEHHVLLNEQHRTVTRAVTLGQVASTVVTSFSLTGPAPFPDTQPYTLEVTYNPSVYPEGFSYWLYLSTSADVSSTKFTAAFGGGSNQNPTQLWLSRRELLKKGFKSGDRVYVVAYGAPGREVSYAEPTNEAIQLVSNLNPTPSQVQSFLMP